SKAVPAAPHIFCGPTPRFAGVPPLHKTPPYDPIADFTPISLIGRFTFFLFVSPSVPARTLAELIEYARANPGKLNYGTGNTTAIVSTAQLKLLAGLNMAQIPNKADATPTPDHI